MPTPNFRMVRLAREMRRLSQTRLATLSGIPQANLSRIEANLRTATESEINRLAAALELPAEFFFEPDAPSAAPMFRKRAIRAKSTNDMVQARLNMAVLAARRIIDAGVHIDAPLAFPNLDDVPADDPVGAARMLRVAWAMPRGRVDNVTALIEAAGGIVLRVDFGTDAASAALLAPLGENRLWFLVNTQETAGDRVRMTLAHELGHAVMHRWSLLRDEKHDEGDAFTFASAFTLPPEEFNRMVPGDLTLSRARDLKRAYWMSIQAIVLTSHARGLITKTRYQSLYRQISARGWRHEEPEHIPLEQPTIWPSVLDVHRTHHGYSDDDLATIARCTPDLLADLFPENFTRRLRVLPGGNDGTGRSPRLTIKPPLVPHTA